MSTFDEDLHPRGQASNAGQFRAKANTAPVGSLEPQAHEPTPDETAAAVAEEFYEFGTPEDGIKSGYLEAGTVHRMMVEAIEADRRTREKPAPTAPEQPASVAEWHGLLADVNTMGGDEIRALDDDTLTSLDAYLLQGAQRVQAAFAERGLRHETDAPAGVDKLEVVDYRNVTEAQVAHAFIAGTGQGVVGGIIRTKDDFYNHAMDEHGEADEALVDRAWEKFSTAYGLQLHDVDAPWAADEYQAWTTSVADALTEARNG